jgi:hypothetical protein
VAVGRHDPRTPGESAGGERYVGGDADIGAGYLLGDPVIGGVAASPTITIRTEGKPGGRIGRDPFDTTNTSAASRPATRYTSSRTGQASAST